MHSPQAEVASKTAHGEARVNALAVTVAACLSRSPCALPLTQLWLGAPAFESLGFEGLGSSRFLGAHIHLQAWLGAEPWAMPGTLLYDSMLLAFPPSWLPRCRILGPLHRKMRLISLLPSLLKALTVQA